jgi:hypothetical protein
MGSDQNLDALSLSVHWSNRRILMHFWRFPVSTDSLYIFQGPMHTGFGVRDNADISLANSITWVNFDYPLPFTPYAHRGCKC